MVEMIYIITMVMTIAIAKAISIFTIMIPPNSSRSYSIA